MSEDKSNVIPINRKIIEALGVFLEGLSNTLICPDQNFDAVFVTREGFMKTMTVKGAYPTYKIPKCIPFDLVYVKEESPLIMTEHPVLNFRLDKKINGKLWYREI